MFIVTQAGQIFVASSDETNATPATLFLDIQDRVGDEGNEEGLLGMALDPGFGQNSLFYLYYTLGSPRPSRLSRFSLSSSNPIQANPNSEQVPPEYLSRFKITMAELWLSVPTPISISGSAMAAAEAIRRATARNSRRFSAKSCASV
jgi:hypothetical protein